MHSMTDRAGASRGRQAIRFALHLLFGLCLAVGLVLLFGAFVMLLWNAVLPDLLDVSPIGYWRSVGLLLLTRILMGSLGMTHGRHSRRLGRNAWRDYDEWWRQVGEESLRQSLREECQGPPDDSTEAAVENPRDS